MAAAETEAEVGARRAAAASARDRELELQRQADLARQEADAVTASLSRSVLAVSQANIKLSHLEEQEAALEAALAALAAGGAGAAAALALQPLHDAQHLQRLVRGSTPHDAVVGHTSLSLPSGVVRELERGSQRTRSLLSTSSYMPSRGPYVFT